jgi:hypothetical protein
MVAVRGRIDGWWNTLPPKVISGWNASGFGLQTHANKRCPAQRTDILVLTTPSTLSMLH